MCARVVFATDDGQRAELEHGDFIGRLATAALCLPDPRVSEAHAMVSLRSGRLHLLALRGRFRVDGVESASTALSAGAQIAFAPGVVVDVLAVELPGKVLAVELPGGMRQILAGLTSLVAAPEVALVPGFRPDAAAWCWPDGLEWRLRTSDGDGRALVDGDAFAVGAHVVRVVALPLSAAAAGTTLVTGAFTAPLRIEACYETVHIFRGQDLLVSVGGQAARLISELVAFDGPVSWQVAAGELWGRDNEPSVLRNRLDVMLSRLRRQLRAAGVRSDLINTTGAGQLELMLRGEDVIVDRT